MARIDIIKPSVKLLTSFDDGALEHLEELIRVCYKSEDRITEGSAEKLIKRIIDSDHSACLEFLDATFNIITDRGITHEIVRHRMCSFLQESTRYVDYQKNGLQVIYPLTMNQNPMSEEFIAWENACLQACRAYFDLRRKDVIPQNARALLPTCVKTEINWKANLREWRHILKLRCGKAAHPDMRRIAIPILLELQSQIPLIFDDIEYDPNDTDLARSEEAIWE